MVGRLWAVAGVLLAAAAGAEGDRFSPVSVPGEDLTLVPESERKLQRVVVGIQPNVTRYFMLPSTEPWDPKSADPRVRFLRRQLYWLNLEFMHGRLYSALPTHTRVFAALPSAQLAGSLGNEREVFEDYLRTHAGWSAADIAARMRYFSVPQELPFPQDQAELLGRDSRGRLVLGLGDDGIPYYLDAARRLAAAFPDEFVVRPLHGVNTEGGDIELVWLPEGVPGLMVGRHRALFRLARLRGEGVLGRPASEDGLERVRKFYRDAFFGLEVIIVGEEGLRHPRLVSDTVFHMDMVLNVMRVGSRVVAFIPSYEPGAVDAINLEPLAVDVVRRAQAEYDAVAVQLRRRGYDVVRLPTSDHPVRNPVNVARYISPSGRPTVLLGRYPYHRRLPAGTSPQFEIQNALDALAAAVERWHLESSPTNWERLRAAIAGTWQAIDAGLAAPNPTFERQAAIYRAAGVDVIAVPMLAGGEGGIHCSLFN